MTNRPEFVSLRPAVVATPKAKAATLPFTGVDVAAIALVGLLLLGTGAIERYLVRD